MVMVTACSLLRQLGYLKSSSYKLIYNLWLKGSIKVDDGSKECAVCLCGMGDDDDEELMSHLQCKHVFHKSCLDRWVEHRGQTCPLCRSHFEAEPGCNGRKISSIVFCPFGDSGISDRDALWIR